MSQLVTISDPTIAKIRAARSEINNLKLGLEDPVDHAIDAQVQNLHAVLTHLTGLVAELLDRVIDDLDEPSGESEPPVYEHVEVGSGVPIPPKEQANLQRAALRTRTTRLFTMGSSDMQDAKEIMAHKHEIGTETADDEGGPE